MAGCVWDCLPARVKPRSGIFSCQNPARKRLLPSKHDLTPSLQRPFPSLQRSLLSTRKPSWLYKGHSLLRRGLCVVCKGLCLVRGASAFLAKTFALYVFAYAEKDFRQLRWLPALPASFFPVFGMYDPLTTPPATATKKGALADTFPLTNSVLQVKPAPRR